jgi:hypothetical protein
MIQSTTSFDNQDFVTLLSAAQISPYIMVKVYLQKELKNYKACLITLLGSDSNTIQNREKVIFNLFFLYITI